MELIKTSNEILVKRLGTGDVMIFDKVAKDLYILPPERGALVTTSNCMSLDEAKDHVSKNEARYYSRSDLETLQLAVSGVLLLV